MKGSFALESSCKGKARPAADLDLAYPHVERLGRGHFPGIVDAWDSGNGFSFASELMESRSKELGAINYGLSRYSVRCEYRDQTFFVFHVDISLWNDSLEASTRDVENFNLLGTLTAKSFRQLPRGVQIAEKFHAYSLPLPPYGQDRKWKAKHLADLLLLIDDGVPALAELAAYVQWTFGARDTHEPPVRLTSLERVRKGAEEFEIVARMMSLTTKDPGAAFLRVSAVWADVIDHILRSQRS